LIEEGDPILIDIPSKKIELLVDSVVLDERRRRWSRPKPRVSTGYLARYAHLVTSGARGAVLEIGSDNS
jgi:dihydroxy-acid dehydratase